MTSYASLGWDFCSELVKVAVVSYAHRLLGLRTLEARIAKLEREVDSVLERAREGKCPLPTAKVVRR